MNNVLINSWLMEFNNISILFCNCSVNSVFLTNLNNSINGLFLICNGLLFLSNWYCKSNIWITCSNGCPSITETIGIIQYL